MKHTSILLSAALIAQSVVGLALPVSAQTATMTVNAGNDPSARLKDFDVLALDFNIQTVVGDQLKALVLAKQGTAREVNDYIAVHLYADRGIAGLQGWGYDQYLGQAQFESGLWVFPTISYTFAQANQRFFVTIDTSNLPQDKILQLSLLQAGDNGNGVYNAGEQGVFLASQVIAVAPEPAYSNIIRISDARADNGAPATFINNVSIEASQPTLLMSNASEVVFTGEAKDRNGGTVQSVRLLVNNQEVVAETTDVSFSKWKATYVPSQLTEALTIHVVASDGSNESTGPAYYMNIDARAVDAAKSSVTLFPDHVVVGQATQIKAIVRAANGDPLSGRVVTFTLIRSADLISADEVITDANGQALVTFTPQAIGTAKVDVHIGAMQIGSATAIVTESTTQEPPANPELPFQVGDLLKGSLSAVYYYASDGERHVFVNAAIYASWYGTDFSKVKTISDAALASIVLGKPVPFKPGTMIKVPSLPEVYVVDISQTLRHITSEEIALQLFGATWNKQVHDLSEALLFTYDFGAPVAHSQDLDKTLFDGPLLTINTELTQ